MHGTPIKIIPLTMFFQPHLPPPPKKNCVLAKYSFIQKTAFSNVTQYPLKHSAIARKPQTKPLVNTNSLTIYTS